MGQINQGLRDAPEGIALNLIEQNGHDDRHEQMQCHFPRRDDDRVAERRHRLGISQQHLEVPHADKFLRTKQSLRRNKVLKCDLQPNHGKVHIDEDKNNAGQQH